MDGTRDHRGLDQHFRSVVQWCSPDERETALSTVTKAAMISQELADNARLAVIEKYRWRIH